MTDVKIELFKPLESWVAVDFVKYFYTKCDLAYGKDTYIKNFDKDAMIMRRVLDLLFQHHRTPKDILAYIDWIYERSQDKKKTFLKLQIELVKTLIPDYFHIIVAKPRNKKKRKTVALSEDTKKWIKAEKKKIEKLKKSGDYYVGF